MLILPSINGSCGKTAHEMTLKVLNESSLCFNISTLNWLDLKEAGDWIIWNNLEIEAF